MIAIAGVDLVWKRENLQLPGTQNEIISPLLWLSRTKPSAAEEQPGHQRFFGCLNVSGGCRLELWLYHSVLDSFLVSAQVLCKQGFARAGIPTLFPLC